MARRRLIRFAILGIASYALAMVWTLPASVAFKNRPWRTGVAGTVWNGEVGVAGGTSVAWRWAPLRSLTSLGFAADWTATGPDTDLGGRATLRPGGMALEDVSGSAAATLLQAIQPNLPFTCDLAAQVEFPHIVVGGSGQRMQGRATTDAGSCRARTGGVPTPVPPLAVTAEKTGNRTLIRVAPAAQRLRTLISATLAENGTLSLTVTRDGAQALPFLGVPGEMTIQGRM